MAEQPLSSLIPNYGLGVDIASPQDYEGLINQAYVGLGQPANDNGRYETTQDFIRGLSSSFVDNYYKKTGKVPTVDQVKQFVAFNADTSNAKQFITGTLNADKMNALSNMYIESNPEIVAANSQPTDLGATAEQINALFDPLQKNAIEANSRNFAPLRARAVEEEAALGRLRSGVSADPSSTIGQVDVNEANSLSSVIGNILGQKASGTLDLNKFNQSLDFSKQNAADARNQFNQNLAFNKNAYSDQMDLAQRQLSLSALLGRLQGSRRKNNGIAGASGGALSGAASGALLGSIVPGIGTGIGAAGGALVGGLGGYFGSAD